MYGGDRKTETKVITVGTSPTVVERGLYTLSDIDQKDQRMNGRCNVVVLIRNILCITYYSEGTNFVIFSLMNG